MAQTKRIADSGNEIGVRNVTYCVRMLFCTLLEMAGSGEALAGFRRAMTDRETFEAALRCTLCKQGMAESFPKSKQRAVLEALVRDKKGLLAILPAGYGKLLVYQLSFSRCIQCHPWESEFGEFVYSSCFTVRITHTQQFLHSDWLRTCQFIQTERQNVKLSAK